MVASLCAFDSAAPGGLRLNGCEIGPLVRLRRHRAVCPPANLVPRSSKLPTLPCCVFKERSLRLYLDALRPGLKPICVSGSLKMVARGLVPIIVLEGTNPAQVERAAENFKKELGTRQAAGKRVGTLLFRGKL